MAAKEFQDRVRESAARFVAIVFVAIVSAVLLTALSLLLSRLGVLSARHAGIIWLLPLAGVLTFLLYRLLRVPFFLDDAEVIHKVNIRHISLHYDDVLDASLSSVEQAPGVSRDAHGSALMEGIAAAGEKLESDQLVSVDEAVQKKPIQPSHLVIAILLGTTLTIAFGGSVGGESAAFQVGSAVALFGAIPWLFSHIAPSYKEKIDTTLLARCGMTSALAALFATPLTSALFIAEMSSLRTEKRSWANKAKIFGFMYASALVGTFICKLVKGEAMGLQFLPLELPAMESFGLVSTSFVLLALFVLVLIGALVWYYALELGRKVGHKFVFSDKQQGLALSLRVVVLLVGAGLIGSIFVFAVSPFLDHGETGTGSALLTSAINGNLLGDGWQTVGTSLAKLLLTVVLLSGLFKGGDLTPTMAIGAALGAGCAALLGLPVAFGALVGLSIFLPVCTNCILAAVALAFETYGLVGCAVSIPFALVAYLLTMRVSFYQNIPRHKVLE